MVEPGPGPLVELAVYSDTGAPCDVSAEERRLFPVLLYLLPLPVVMAESNDPRLRAENIRKYIINDDDSC